MQMLYVEHDSTQEVVCRVQCTRRGYIQATAVIRLACTNLQTFMESKTESSKRHAQNTDINTNVKCFQNSHITNATSVKRIMSNYKSHQIQTTTKPQNKRCESMESTSIMAVFYKRRNMQEAQESPRTEDFEMEEKAMQNQRDAMQDKDKQCERSKILKCKNARLSNTRCWLRT